MLSTARINSPASPLPHSLDSIYSFIVSDLIFHAHRCLEVTQIEHASRNLHMIMPIGLFLFPVSLQID